MTAPLTDGVTLDVEEFGVDVEDLVVDCGQVDGLTSEVTGLGETGSSRRERPEKEEEGERDINLILIITGEIQVQ